MSSTTPIERLASHRVGTVEFVSPDEIKVVLDVESPDSIALNTGLPRPFPRINGYLLVPIDLGYVVGQISWITIERSNFPVRKGFRDFGLVDLPFPLRKLQLQPVGTLTIVDGKQMLTRGVETFPSVGDIVLLPTDDQIKAIVESGKNRRVYIGDSVLVGGAKIKIDPDRLFGRHLAVLGNTGSGKSCSVAGLIRWSIENARNVIDGDDKSTNSRFILLDPNGEYHHAFADMPSARLFTVQPDEVTEKIQQFQVPLWFWNTEEWCGFTKATTKTQRPTIIQALKNVKSGNVSNPLTEKHILANYVKSLLVSLNSARLQGLPWDPNYSKKRSFYDVLAVWPEGLKDNDDFEEELNTSITTALQILTEMIKVHEGNGFHTYVYSPQKVAELYDALERVYRLAGGKDEDLLPINADTPRPYTGKNFVDAINISAEYLKTSDYVDSVVNLVKALVDNVQLKPVISETTISLEEWLTTYIGDNKSENLTIIDLSLLPAEVVTTVTAVISRMIFEALQRYRKATKLSLPTVLVVEEAHHFIKRYNEDSDFIGSTALCCKVFERIAREGRKFGLGLLISSQRPSELSPTVLSQCNSFLIHRISNDRDQELIARLLPDNMRGMLRELPSLPSQNAILLGWASELPVLVRMRTLQESQRPQSEDPDFWDVWTYHTDREVDWKAISKEWQDSHNE